MHIVPAGACTTCCTAQRCKLPLVVSGRQMVVVFLLSLVITSPLLVMVMALTATPTLKCHIKDGPRTVVS